MLTNRIENGVEIWEYPEGYNFVDDIVEEPKRYPEENVIDNVMGGLSELLGSCVALSIMIVYYGFWVVIGLAALKIVGCL